MGKYRRGSNGVQLVMIRFPPRLGRKWRRCAHIAYF